MSGLSLDTDSTYSTEIKVTAGDSTCPNHIKVLQNTSQHITIQQYHTTKMNGLSDFNVLQNTSQHITIQQYHTTKVSGLSERFAQLQLDPTIGPVKFTLRLFQDMFFPSSSNDDPLSTSTKTKHRQKAPLRVFGAGLPRSGTGSLTLALSQLGYSPLHGPGTLELAPILEKHYHGISSDGSENNSKKKASLRDLIEWQEEHGYDAQGLDQLGWKLYEEVTDSYPDVKIVLTLHPRGADAWAASFTSFVPECTYWFGFYPFRFSKSWQSVMILWRDFLEYVGGTDNPRDPIFSFPGDRVLAEAYEQHNAAVIAKVPSDRLLVFDPTQGWEPLCQFLELGEETCPSTPYPHMTDRKLMMAVTKVAQTIVWIWSGIPVLAIAIVVYWFVVRRKLRKRNQKAKPKSA